MSAILIRAFNGLKPIVDPILLENGDATVAKNVRLTSGAIVPLSGSSSFKPLNVNAPQTIWRYGYDTSESNYWFEFAGDVNVVSSPIPTDVWARAYWTDGSQPRYGVAGNMLAGSGGPYPAASYVLGVPKPEATPGVAETAYSAAKAVISASDVAMLKVGDILSVAVDGGSAALLTLTGNNGLVTAATLASQLDAVTGILATAADGAVTVTTETSSPTSSVIIKRKTGVAESYAPEDVTYSDLLGPATGVAQTTGSTTTPAASAIVTLTVPMLSRMWQGDSIRVRVSGVETIFVVSSAAQVAATSLAAQINSVVGVSAKADNGAVVVNTDATGETATLEVAWQTVQYTDGPFEILGSASGSDAATTDTVVAAQGASVTFTGSIIAGLAVDCRLALTINGGAPVAVKVGAGVGTFPSAVTATSLKTPLAATQGVVAAVVDGNPQQVTLTTTLTGTSATLLVRLINPKVTDVFGAFAGFDNAADITAATKETRVYVYTYVSAYDEEGPPSGESQLVNVDPSMAVTLTGMSVAPTGAYNITKKRIYRSSTVNGVAQFQYVDEVPVAQTDYTDTKLQAELGEVLLSENWDPPPAALKGLKVLASGACIGFVENTVWMSEPNQPHAWPHSYPVELRIVGIGVFRQSAVALTTGHPYMITGVDPAAMTIERMEFPQACVSKRSIVDTGDGTLYASPDGLVTIGSSGMKVITESLMTREQWQSYNPASIIGAIHDGRYHAHYTKTDGSRGVLVFDFSGQGAILTESDIASATAITAFYSDARTDTLYFAQGGFIGRFNNSGTPLTGLWRSKVFRMIAPISLGAAALDAASYPTDVPIKVRFYAGDQLKHERVVTSAESFRLPTGFREQDWQFEIETTVKVTRLRVATNSIELRPQA